MSFVKIKKRNFVFVAVFLILSLGMFFAVPSKSTTAVIPFGGKILKAQYCPCSANIRLTIGPPVPGIFIFQPGVSIPFAFGQVYRSGPWTIGNWVPGGVCLKFSATGCRPVFSEGTILEVGTSI